MDFFPLSVILLLKGVQNLFLRTIDDLNEMLVNSLSPPSSPKFLGDLQPLQNSHHVSHQAKSGRFVLK